MVRAMTHLAPEALRAARAILKWSTADLARESGVAPMTINAIENGRPARAGTAERLSATLAAQGVEVLGEPTPGARRLPRE
jgi:transcriptional regulator with XRE-family HTH domain